MKKPINRVAKGQRIEKRCFDELSGYTFRWKTIRHRFLNIDIFGLFDVVVANKKHIRWIQVKTGYCSKAVREEIKKCRLPAGNIKEVWEWFGAERGWRKSIIN